MNDLENMTNEDYILQVTFQDGTEKYYGVSKLFLKWDIFQNLKTVTGLFNQVKVNKGGYGISSNLCKFF